jgi:two-component system cell cycle response regulator CtrA
MNLERLSWPDGAIGPAGKPPTDDNLPSTGTRRRVIGRRAEVVAAVRGHSDSIVKTGKLTVNLDTRTVGINGQPLHLTGKEYGILELLSLRKGTTLTKEMFLNHLYGGKGEPDLKIIDVFVCKLRKKLTAGTGGENYIETIWGRGYVLRDPVDELERGDEEHKQVVNF